ncbi:MAG: HDOD domain-containing protein, partial [Gammaproteobacteria bacterium]|nr:HDOD domain-containing protein [Gammaproteobacteria bacterium]
IRTLHDEDVNIPQVRELIAKDPALTAKVMQAANSAALGLRREIGTLDAAITMLGLSQVRSLALTACMNVAFPVAPGLERAEFWRNCMACAGYAQWLAGGIGLDSQQAWLAGMMLRLGELLIVQTRPQTLAVLERQPQIPGDRWQREQQLLGFTEAHVTAELAHRWHFPTDIVRAINVAPTPLAALPLSQLGATLHLASRLADMAFSDPNMIDALPQDVIAALDLNLDWMRNKLPDRDGFLDLSSF